MTQPHRPGLYFDSQRLPAPLYAYVAWLDVMGVRATMSRSLPVTANFVFKLHVAALEAPRDEIVLYPVMDGLYIVTEGKAALCKFLGDVFARLAGVFVTEADPQHRFVVKCAVAFGPVIHGAELPREASRTLDEFADYRAAVLLGMPMVQAVQGESKAPPFGVFIHESARAFANGAEQPFGQVWWRWWRSDDAQTRDAMRAAMGGYYAWAKDHHSSIEYDPERIRIHEAMATEYFREEPA